MWLTNYSYSFAVLMDCGIIVLNECKVVVLFHLDNTACPTPSGSAVSHGIGLQQTKLAGKQSYNKILQLTIQMFNNVTFVFVACLWCKDM